MIPHSFNPFALVSHNNFRLFGRTRFPRVFWHLTHALLGIPGALVFFAGWPVCGAALCLLAATLDKIVQPRWAPRFHLEWRGWRVQNYWDCVADFGLASWPLLFPHIWAMLGGYYLLSLTADPFPGENT